LEFSDVLWATIPILILEYIAAIAGIFFLKNSSNYTNWDKYFVWYLWLTCFVETIGLYSPLAYYTDYAYFSFVRDTSFISNYWLYNAFTLVSISFYCLYFISYLKSINKRKVLTALIFVYMIYSIGHLLMSGVFFKGYSQVILFSGVLLLIINVIFYYFELLRSDQIMNVKYLLPIYVSVGALLFYICVTPILFLSNYFSTENSLFVNLRINVMLYANIFLYSTYTFGFLICSKKRKYF